MGERNPTTNQTDGSPGDLFELDPVGQHMFAAQDPFTSASTLDPGLYLSDPQGHAFLVGHNGRSMALIDGGINSAEVGGVLIESPELLEQVADRLRFLAGRIRERTAGGQR